MTRLEQVLLGGSFMVVVLIVANWIVWAWGG